MAWHEVLGQKQAVSLLRRAVRAGRVAHAYLFHGPDGVGKRAVAIAFARTLQCSASGDSACGDCKSCEEIRGLRHPDVHILLPQPSDASPEEAGARIRHLAKNPYATVGFSRSTGGNRKSGPKKQAFYPIRRIKDELHHILGLRPGRGGYRFVVITAAEAMQAPAANALLKVLEEPGDRTVLILITSRPDLLLPTILSRCQRVRFGPLEEATIAHALEQRQNVESSSARLYARMAAGSYSAALHLASSGALQEERQTALNFLKHAYTRRAADQVSLVEELMQGGREHVKSVLEHTLVWIRDLMLWRALQEESDITNIDQVTKVSAFASRLAHADIEAMARLVDEGRLLVSQEVNLKVLLINLSNAVGRAMRGPSAGRLYLPLA